MNKDQNLNKNVVTMRFTVRRNNKTTSLIPYVGNKSGFTHIFDKLIPEKFSDLIFYDIFGGGSAFTIYACRRFGSKNVVYNDNNPVIVNLIKQVQKNPLELTKEFKKHQKKSSLDYYNKLRNMNLHNDLESAGRFLYLAKNAFSGKIRFNAHGKFNCPMRKNTPCRNIDEEHILQISSLIKDLRIYNESFEYFSNVKNSFFYLDPPYMNNPNHHYNRSINENDFIRFMKTVEKRNRIMISEQNTPTFLQLSKRYAIHDVIQNTSLQYFTRDSSKEIIAINYSIPKLASQKPLISKKSRILPGIMMRQSIYA